MTLDYIKRLFAYNQWANQAFLVTLQRYESDLGDLRLFAHILAAERLWLERLTGVQQSMPVWPSLTIEECETLLSELHDDWNLFLSDGSHDALNMDYEYVNSKGERWTSTVADTLLHVVTHGSYHRGQLAADLRRVGVDPPYTDFIQATRSGRLDDT